MPSWDREAERNMGRGWAALFTLTALSLAATLLLSASSGSGVVERPRISLSLELAVAEEAETKVPGNHGAKGTGSQGADASTKARAQAVDKLAAKIQHLEKHASSHGDENLSAQGAKLQKKAASPTTEAKGQGVKPSAPQAAKPSAPQAAKPSAPMHPKAVAPHPQAIKETKASQEETEAPRAALASASYKVPVTLYMESECPACKKYTKLYIAQLLQTPGVKEIVNFKFVPWGNGHVQKEGVFLNTTEQLEAALEEVKADDSGKTDISFNCQHGGTECQGNAIESCIQTLYPEEHAFFPVIDCIEATGCAEGEIPPYNCTGLAADIMGSCIKNYGTAAMSAKAVNDCVYSKQSTLLLLENAIATKKQNNSWVPWVTVNGKHLGGTTVATANDIFLVGQHVCDHYAQATGQPAPHQCSQLPQQVPKNPFGDSMATELGVKVPGEQDGYSFTGLVKMQSSMSAILFLVLVVGTLAVILCVARSWSAVKDSLCPCCGTSGAEDPEKAALQG